MRKFIYGMAILFAGVMASCGGHKTAEETVATDTVVTEEVCDSVVTPDSVAVDSSNLETEAAE